MNAWKFIKLLDNTVFIDKEDYYIKTPDKIMGILSAMVEQNAWQIFRDRQLRGLVA